MDDKEIFDQLSSELNTKNKLVKDTILNKAENQTLLVDCLTLFTKGFCSIFRSFKKTSKRNKEGDMK